MRFKDLRLGRKLMLMAGLILALTTTISVTAVVQVGRLADSTREVTTSWMPSVQALLTLARSTTFQRVLENRRLLLADDLEARRSTATRIDAQIAKIAEQQKAYEPLITSDAERALYDAYRATWADYLKVAAEVRSLMDSGRNEESRALLLGNSLKLFNTLSEQLDKLVAHNEAGARAEAERADGLGRSTGIVIMVLGAAAVVLGLLFAAFTARAISRPVEQMVDVARSMAAGDFTAAMPPPSRDEVGQLVEAMTGMRDGLRRVIADVRASASAVSTASQQIAGGTQDLSARTEQQAASLEETASAMDELSGTLRSSADVAGQADALTGSATEVAQRGGEAVTKVVNTMSGIADSSRRITDIISVIDGIAFQTNILALNAAVEAARAGEQGRGFAVVATEVRTLAQRSGEAAREIKSLISASVAQVDDGNRAAAEAGRIVEDVVRSIREVRGMVAEIASSAQQQAQGVGQVNEAVSQIDATTQQNAALVEESSAAAASLREQAASLARAVETFKV
ncbi:MAG: methyl-accepting chemotaxis protein [Burkholderiales bacterium]|jgi:methyl-accepting chemotaxis protein